ncbi:YeeE/YedE family protein [Hydrogenovibrio halophilus]|uniref:YeeE/YedE family protein n=1 Tax=Hydrogenovibrio halophilus TaxID=373391 RepID=UPI00036B5833|nr:YeeE/YedE family protein [Hydrogenovibrio halophilus]
MQDPRRSLSLTTRVTLWLFLALVALSLGLHLSQLLPGLVTFVTGVLLGMTLHAMHYGFRSCSHALLQGGHTLGLRTLLWMLALASVLFFGLLAWQPGPEPMTGMIQPLSLAVVIGAFAFGIGMQLGHGCTSGTLNKLGQFQPLSMWSFLGLLIGGTLAAWQIDFWRSLPALAPITLFRADAPIGSLLTQLTLLALLYAWVTRLERRRSGQVQPLIHRRIWQVTHWHPWLLAAVSLACLNAWILYTTGRPWTLANVFPYWGLSIADASGLASWLQWDWPFWSYAIAHQQRLSQPILSDDVSLVALGLIAGALLVSLIHAPGKRFSAHPFKWRLAHGLALIGGVLMGYGALIAYGCNIGAFFSGIASGSLHGWLWAVAALGGSRIGLGLLRASGQR